MFAPSKEIRAFKASDLIGMVISFRVSHGDNQMDKDKEIENHYVNCETNLPLFISPSGWTGKLMGKIGDTFNRKLVDVYLMEKKNGGRNNPKKYKSYKEYFGKELKEEMHKKWCGGIMYKLSRCGDPEMVDIVFKFLDFEIESSQWDFRCPEEWYSDYHKNNSKFKFADGFYDSADKAIEIFNKKSHDDLFGTRFFPVIVMPKEKHREASEVAYVAKSCSSIILRDDNVIIGTRCKSHEFEEIIEKTYSAGGKIPIGVEWDWE